MAIKKPFTGQPRQGQQMKQKPSFLDALNAIINGAIMINLINFSSFSIIMPQLNPAYKEANINKLSKSTLKIAVSGIIVNKEESSITIDDGTGSLPILITTELPLNSFVKVYGMLIPLESNYEMQGHVIQDLSNINQKLHKKIKSSLE